MPSGDGLLARVHIAGGRMSPSQLADLAALAGRYGNGMVEVTARGNLQVRGLRPDTAPAFAKAVTALLPVETGLVIDLSPLAGDDPTETADPRPLRDAIRQGAQTLEDRLGPKVSVVIDGGGQISLAGLKADIRLVARGGGYWSISLGGGKPQVMAETGAVAATLAVLGALAAMGPEARAVDLFPVRTDASNSPPPHPNPPRKGEGVASQLDPPPPPLRGRLAGGGNALQLRHGYTTPLALPFGQMDGQNLAALARAAEAAGANAIRLAPGHRLLIDDAPDALLTQAATFGFITDPADPRLRVSACIGSDGCASGHIAARRLGAQLASAIPAGQRLHVSGCSKGCAHPRRADLTLVGRADGIGLVIGGGAGDTPLQILDEPGILSALAARREGR